MDGWDHILELLWQRSEQGLTALARQFGNRLYQTAINILGIHRDAEECVNDTYLAIWNAIPPSKPEPLAPFVYRTGRNIAINRLRANNALKRSGYELSLEELSDCIAGPEMWQTLDARALGRSIDAFLSTLSRENRVIFLRRYWFGDSVKDIATAASLSENAVSVRLRRTRDRLKAHLTKEGFYE